MENTKKVIYHDKEGKSYDWSADQTFVKVSASDTSGAYTLMEDNIKPIFNLGLHRHDHHQETFYILEGDIEFYLDGEYIHAKAGTTIHIPKGMPHACRAMNDHPARMLMIYQPAGFDLYLEELAQMTEADFEDGTKMAALDAKYDNIQLGPFPEKTT